MKQLSADVTATVHVLGFATRAALSFGGARPGDFRRVLQYNKKRLGIFKSGIIGRDGKFIPDTGVTRFEYLALLFMAPIWRLGAQTTATACSR